VTAARGTGQREAEADGRSGRVSLVL